MGAAAVPEGSSPAVRGEHPPVLHPAPCRGCCLALDPPSPHSPYRLPSKASPDGSRPLESGVSAGGVTAGSAWPPVLWGAAPRPGCRVSGGWALRKAPVPARLAAFEGVLGHAAAGTSHPGDPGLDHLHHPSCKRGAEPFLGHGRAARPGPGVSVPHLHGTQPPG